MHDICEATRLVPCGYCWAGRGESCGFTGTRARPLDGWHLARFARARRKGLISEAEMAVALDAAGVIANHVILRAEAPMTRAGSRFVCLYPDYLAGE